MSLFDDARQDVLDDIDVLRSSAPVQLEDRMSVRESADRVAAAVRSAFGLCRAGVVMEEYKTWIEAASFCAARAEQIRRQQISDGT